MFRHFLLFVVSSSFIYCNCRCCKCCRFDYVKRLLKNLNINLDKYNRNKYLAVKDNYDIILKIIKNFSDDEKWKMFVDGKDQSEGKYVYDRPNCGSKTGEPGYLESMLNAWNYMISTLGKKIKIHKDRMNDDNDIYLKMHKYTCNNVSNMLEDSDYYRKTDRDVCFEICSDSKSKITKNLIKYQNKLKNEGFEPEKISNWEIDFKKREITCCYFSKIEQSEDFLNSGYSSGSRYLANKIFTNYYNKLAELKKSKYIKGSFLSKDASYEDKILELIVRTVSTLMWSHIFPDGNGRLNIYLVLNKLLIENNLLPVIIYYPHDLVCNDVFFGIDLIKDGQNDF